ncbi:GH3 auxin-responsive promoter family protein [Paraliomyxa miuraensis]|uniref:GH3 auxin-responsive promoter family protein n=1 Tax=Paraliomyxa miuraensis TaxID=376150 RepID=UPI002252F827|nr:GH3 auxin-responsive promoter family protein [Paraliomyxa miuraensis]MCX4239451.1 GH3 auxin-responsive promoter family protein [Paraliomyxa miuraensis]
MLLDRFEASARRARSLDLRTLQEIVAANRDTEFGRAHGFGSLDLREDAAAYRRAVPLHAYADLAPYVERMAEGERGVLCAEAPSLFAMSSGTSGQPKLVPITPRLQALQVRCYGGLIPAVAGRRIPGGGDPHRGIMLISGADSGLRTRGGIPMGSASAGGIVKMRRIMPLLWTTPFEALVVGDRGANGYLHALFGLRELEAKFIQTAFCPTVVSWLRMIEDRFETLVRDIEHGTLDPSLRLTSDERARIEPRLRADPVRAEELRRAVAHGFSGFVPRAWPHLRYVAAVITGSFGAYVPNLRHYIGDALPIFTIIYIASEGIIGLNLWPDEPERYALAAGMAAFEFIPVAQVDDPSPTTVGLDGLHRGDEYEVVLTNHAGLYRYRMTDVVRVVDFVEELPVISFCHRRGELLDLVGERLTPRHTRDAVEGFVCRFGGPGARLMDYTTARDTESTPPRHVFYVEMVGAEGSSIDQASAHLDAALVEHCHAHAFQTRSERQIGMPRVKLMQPGAFDRLAQWRLDRSPGASQNQLKTPRVVDDPELLGVLEQLVLAQTE